MEPLEVRRPSNPGPYHEAIPVTEVPVVRTVHDGRCDDRRTEQPATSEPTTISDNVRKQMPIATVATSSTRRDYIPQIEAENSGTILSTFPILWLQQTPKLTFR